MIKTLRSVTKAKINSFLNKELQIKQLKTSLEQDKKIAERLLKENYSKTLEIDTINQKLLIIQQKYENNLKVVSKLPDDNKRITKEK